MIAVTLHCVARRLMFFYRYDTVQRYTYDVKMPLLMVNTISVWIASLELCDITLGRKALKKLGVSTYWRKLCLEGRGNA